MPSNIRSHGTLCLTFPSWVSLAASVERAYSRLTASLNWPCRAVGTKSVTDRPKSGQFCRPDVGKPCAADRHRIGPGRYVSGRLCRQPL